MAHRRLPPRFRALTWCGRQPKPSALPVAWQVHWILVSRPPSLPRTWRPRRPGRRERDRPDLAWSAGQYVGQVEAHRLVRATDRGHERRFDASSGHGASRGEQSAPAQRSASAMRSTARSTSLQYHSSLTASGKVTVMTISPSADTSRLIPLLGIACIDRKPFALARLRATVLVSLLKPQAEAAAWA